MKKRVVVTGATSQIGDFLLPLLCEQGFQVSAISRSPQELAEGQSESITAAVTWIRKDIHSATEFTEIMRADVLIHLAPLALLVPLLPHVARGGIRRIIAFSSTGRFSKASSNDPKEQATVQRLAQAEVELASFCGQHGINWTVFRPTLIYGCGRDRNVTVIAQFIQRFWFFPLLGESKGLRQPVHTEDLAKACLDVLDNPSAFNKAYNLSGGEILTYRDMVERIFRGVGKRPIFLRVPFSLFEMAMALISRVPRYRDFNVEMARRMNEDLAFEHSEATRDFGYAPRVFRP